MPHADDLCEMRSNLGWESVGIMDALGRRGEDMRCPECNGRVRAHSPANNGMRAHFEHVERHLGCSTKNRGIGAGRTLHPAPLS